MGGDWGQWFMDILFWFISFKTVEETSRGPDAWKLPPYLSSEVVKELQGHSLRPVGGLAWQTLQQKDITVPLLEETFWIPQETLHPKTFTLNDYQTYHGPVDAQAPALKRVRTFSSGALVEMIPSDTWQELNMTEVGLTAQALAVSTASFKDPNLNNAIIGMGPCCMFDNKMVNEKYLQDQGKAIGHTVLVGMIATLVKFMIDTRINLLESTDSEE